MDKKSEVTDKTNNHVCSRCGQCCGLFIPFTGKEVSVIKKYVKEHNITQTNRIDTVTNSFKAHCCFYDEENKLCKIYEVRPYVCRDFKCDRKDWKQRRDMYEKRAKYNSTFSKKTILATFDDMIYQDYFPIFRYILSMLPQSKGGIDSTHLLELLKQVNRLDLLNYITATDDNENTIDGKDIK